MAEADPLSRYRGWLYAAAVYNVVWGATNVLFPRAMFDLLGMPPPETEALWQVVGMFVLLFAPAYWWAARSPSRHRHLVFIGWLGKVAGPIGFVSAWATGALPFSFGWTIITNDLIWLPAFSLFVRDAARAAGGWRPFLLGE